MPVRPRVPRTTKDVGLDLGSTFGGARSGGGLNSTVRQIVTGKRAVAQQASTAAESDRAVVEVQWSASGATGGPLMLDPTSRTIHVPDSEPLPEIDGPGVSIPAGKWRATCRSIVYSTETVALHFWPTGASVMLLSTAPAYNNSGTWTAAPGGATVVGGAMNYVQLSVHSPGTSSLNATASLYLERLA